MHVADIARYAANSDRRTERRRERRAAESSEQRETRLARRRVADRASLSLVWFPDPSVMRMRGRGKKGLGNNYTPARALEFDLHVPLSGCG